jgi:putative peptidoglycan lipid II flippase
MAMVSTPRRSFLRAFMASSVGTGLSRVLGLFRELALANVLGAGMAMDAFVMAFTFPGMLRRFVADEGLTGALVPAVSRAEAEAGEAEARALSGRILTALIAASVVLSTAGVLCAPWLVDWVADGFTGEKYTLTVQLTRILFPFIAFVSLVSWAEGLLNLRGHFFIPKLAPGLVSAAVVAAVLLFRDSSPLEIVWAVSWSVLIGGAVHLAICLPPLYKHWGLIRPRLDMFSDERFRRVLGEMGKVAVIGLMAQVNTIVLRYLASHLQDGAVTWYWNATRLVDFAQGIIAVGVGSALLPAISDAVARGDGAGFRSSFSGAARLAGVLLVPAAAFVLFFPVPCVALLYRHGAYTWVDVQQTASALQLLVPFMLALAGIQIIKKPFFAMERRGALIAVGAIGVCLTAGLGLWLSPTLGVDGLAIALSVSTVLQFAAYLILLRGMVTGGLGLGALSRDVARLTVATLPAVGAAWFIIDMGHWESGPTWANAAVLGGAGIAGGILYGIAATALGVKELRRVVERVRSRMG